jgi:hypothetical protein
MCAIGLIKSALFYQLKCNSKLSLNSKKKKVIEVTLNHVPNIMSYMEIPWKDNGLIKQLNPYLAAKEMNQV